MFMLFYQVTRICYKISKISGSKLRSCSLTGNECITYSRNSMYAYICSSRIHSVQNRGGNKNHISTFVTNRLLMYSSFHFSFAGLPLCIDTEDLRDQILINTTATALFSPSNTCKNKKKYCMKMKENCRKEILFQLN